MRTLKQSLATNEVEKKGKKVNRWKQLKEFKSWVYIVNPHARIVRNKSGLTSGELPVGDENHKGSRVRDVQTVAEIAEVLADQRKNLIRESVVRKDSSSSEDFPSVSYFSHSRSCQVNPGIKHPIYWKRFVFSSLAVVIFRLPFLAARLSQFLLTPTEIGVMLSSQWKT